MTVHLGQDCDSDFGCSWHAVILQGDSVCLRNSDCDSVDCVPLEY